MQLSDEQLLQDLKSMRQQERELVTNILKHLLEVETRSLHLTRGFPSLYEFCMNELGYSKDEAYVRIQAMRCLKAVPSLEEKIESGNISLSVVAKAQTVFKRQAKLQQSLTVAKKEEVLESLLDVSVRQAERLLATQFPEADLPVERIKPLTGDLTRIEFTANQDLMEKLERLKHLLAHKNFDGRMDGLISELADIALKKIEPKVGSAPVVSPERIRSRSAPKRTRYISVSAKREVWQKAEGQCEYLDFETGRRCSGEHGLQIDHVHEFAKGGSNESSNLQLLCGAHNRWKSEN